MQRRTQTRICQNHSGLGEQKSSRVCFLFLLGAPAPRGHTLVLGRFILAHPDSSSSSAKGNGAAVCVYRTAWRLSSASLPPQVVGLIWTLHILIQEMGAHSNLPGDTPPILQDEMLGDLELRRYIFSFVIYKFFFFWPDNFQQTSWEYNAFGSHLGAGLLFRLLNLCGIFSMWDFK